MFNFFKKKLIDWSPVKYGTLKDNSLEEIIFEDGYAIVNDFISEQKLDRIRGLYKTLHKEKPSNKTYWSLFSDDLIYRQNVQNGLYEIVRDEVGSFFINYKISSCNFVIKSSGAEALAIHQDLTCLNELEYSNLSVWFALDDVTENNGALCLIPKTHKLFSPYRAANMDAPFREAIPSLIPYFKRICLKRGQALIFDPRVLHCSEINITSKDRIAVVCGIFPEKAGFVTCSKDENNISVCLHNDDFLLKFQGFEKGNYVFEESGSQVLDSRFIIPKLSTIKIRRLFRNNNIEKENLNIRLS